MSGRRRRELTDSFRLVARDEQWFGRDLVAGVAALLVWVAATGALATYVAGLLDVSLGLAGGETPSPITIAISGVLWLLVPAVAVVFRIRNRTSNLRGNVEQYYRLYHPAALLAPPALLVLASCVVAVALGSFESYFALLMVPVGLFVLVRTLAFSYRVYSFSHPLVVQTLLFVSTPVLLGSAFAAVGAAAGRRALVDRALMAVGLPAWITGTVSVEGVDVSGVAVAALAPVLLALAYVLIQTAVSVGVRLVRPEVARSKMRTGQRYPSFLPGATPVTPSESPVDADDAAPDAEDTARDADDAAPTADADDSSSAGDSPTETDEPEGGDDDLDDVSNTRVFTPPGDDADGDSDADSTPDSGAETGARPSSGPGSSSGTASSETRAIQSEGVDRDASSADERERCDACGESFTVDTAVRFCPNCGTAFEGE